MKKNFIKHNITFLSVLAIVAIILIFLGVISSTLKKVFFVFILLVIVFNLFFQYFSKHAINMLLVASSILMTLLVSDFILRKNLPDNFFYRPHERFGNSRPELSNLKIGRYDKNVNYKEVSYGDLAAMSGVLDYKEPREVKFITDDLGFRNYPNQRKKKNEIILLGDSFGMGSGTHQDSTFTGLLLKKYEGYNLSYPSSPFEELVNLYLEIDKVHRADTATLVWLLFAGNDDTNSITSRAGEYLEQISKNTFLEKQMSNWPTLQRNKLRIFIRRSPLRLIMQNLYRKEINNKKVEIKDFGERKVYFFQPYTKPPTLSKEEILTHPLYGAFKEIFFQAKKIGKDKQLKIKVILIPTKKEVYPFLYNDSFEKGDDLVTPSGFSLVLNDILEELEMDYVDAKPFFKNYASEYFNETGKILWWLDDTHLNVEGHRALSELIEKTLNEK